MAQKFTYHTESTRSMYHVVSYEPCRLFIVRCYRKKTALEQVEYLKDYTPTTAVDVTYQDSLGRVYKIAEWNRKGEVVNHV